MAEGGILACSRRTSTAARWQRSGLRDVVANDDVIAVKDVLYSVSGLRTESVTDPTAFDGPTK